MHSLTSKSTSVEATKTDAGADEMANLILPADRFHARISLEQGVDGQKGGGKRHLRWSSVGSPWTQAALDQDMTHDYARNGTTSLFAALNIAAHNNHPKPFIWTATACDILEK